MRVSKGAIGPQRTTMDMLTSSDFQYTWREKVADSGHRRFLSYGMDFDTRAIILTTEIQPGWNESVKAGWVKNKEQVAADLVRDFGERDQEMKVVNFVAIDSAPFSILSYHNVLFHQVRRSFVIGSYYAALVSACALGERMLNHLILDLREQFHATPQYKKVARKESFDNWSAAVETLAAWDVLLPEVAVEFLALAELRNRSIHFNPETYTNLRDDALKATLHLRKIIAVQFGSFTDAPWFIKGTAGHAFIARDWEQKPFVKTFVLPTCQFMGPLFAIKFDAQHRAVFYDKADYGDGDWTDEEFAENYNNRRPEDLIKPEAHKPE